MYRPAHELTGEQRLATHRTRARRRAFKRRRAAIRNLTVVSAPRPPLLARLWSRVRNLAAVLA